MPGPLTPTDLENIYTMLNITTSIRRQDWGKSNLLTVIIGTKQEASLRRLETFGFVEQIRLYNKGIGYFVATEKGCKLAGLERYEIKRALESRGLWRDQRRPRKKKKKCG